MKKLNSAKQRIINLNEEQNDDWYQIIC
jgi:hypothetical protein